MGLWTLFRAPRRMTRVQKETGVGRVLRSAAGCAVLILAAEPIRNSQLGDNLAKPDWHHHHDHFLDSNPNVRWKNTLAHGEKIGLGTRDYELIRV